MNFDDPHMFTAKYHSRRLLKKAVQQGRRRIETGGVAFPPAQPRAVVTALFPDGVR